MTSVEKRRSGRKSGGHRKHSDGGYSDTSSGGSFLDETDREVSNLTDRAFRSLCIGDEAVYNDSDLCSSPCNQRDRQLAFGQSVQEKDREDREREELKRAAHDNFTLRVQQYGQDWIHGGMYGPEIHRDPQWDVYRERTQGRVSATFQHSFMETSQQESFLSNGVTEMGTQQGRSRSRVSSLIRAFNSEGNRDGVGMDGNLREWNDGTSWDKSALMSIQRELSEFSSYQQNFNSNHFPSSCPFSSQDTSFYSSEVAAMTHMNSSSSFMSAAHSKHSMSTQVNCNSNFFIHSEFSPFKVWRDHNRFPFQQGEVSGFMRRSEFPKWYETPMYKELSLEAQPQVPYRLEERSIRHSRNKMAPVVPPTAPRSTSTSTVMQKASAVEKRCESELGCHYPHRKRTQSLGANANRLPSQRPSTASPTIEISRRVRDTISSVKALQQKLKMMTEQNMETDMTTNQQGALFTNDNLIPFGTNATAVPPNVVRGNTSTAPFNITQQVLPSTYQEASEVRQYAVSPQPVEHAPVRAESRGATPDVRMSSYKSRATSLLFNLKDNRKRVKNTYSPTRFKGMETVEKNKQPHLQEHRDTVIDIPDFPDPEIRFTQVEESSRTNSAIYPYVNQYQNPALSQARLNSQAATTYAGQYSEYALSNNQTVQMQGEMVYHPRFTGFIPENNTTNQLANGQNDDVSFTPYKQGMIDNVDTLGGDVYRLKPSHTAAEMPWLNADNNQTREYLISKPNAEQHFNETVGREFTKVDRYQQFKDNKHDYSNVSSQDRWRQTHNPDTERLSLKAATSPWKQEITALIEDQHTQANQRAATINEESLGLATDKYRRENQQSINKEELRQSFSVGTTSHKNAALVNANITTQLPQYTPFSNNTVEKTTRQQQPGVITDKYGFQKNYVRNEENEVKENYLTQNYNRHTDQEYQNQQTHYSNKAKTMLTQDSVQSKQYMPIPVQKGHEMQSLQPVQTKSQVENNLQKSSLSNPDNAAVSTVTNQVKDRHLVEVKAEQAMAEHRKAPHAQAELAKTQHWAQVEQPKAESAGLILAGQTGPEKVRAKAELTEHEREKQFKAEHKTKDTRKVEQTEQPREKQPERTKEEQIEVEQTTVMKVPEEPRNITEEAEVVDMKEEQGEQVSAERAEAERLKEEHIKTELAIAEKARIQQAAQAKKDRIKVEKVDEEQVRAEQMEKEQKKAEQSRTEKIKKIKAEQVEVEYSADQANLEQIKQQQAKTEQEKLNSGEIGKVKADLSEIKYVRQEKRVEDSIQVGQVHSEQPKTHITTPKEADVEERKEEQTKLEQTKVQLVKPELTKTENLQERLAKPEAKQTAIQQVRNEPDKVEQVKTELAKAKAELAKIKEKMKGEQKERVRNTVNIEHDSAKKYDSPRVNMTKNEDYKKQEWATQQKEDSAVNSVGRHQADRGADDYDNLREKYGFTNVVSTSRKLSTSEKCPLDDANEKPVLSLDKVETVNSKDKHSPTSEFATVNTENKDEVESFKSNEMTESQYVYSESSKEFKLSSANSTHVNDRANTDTDTIKMEEDSVEKSNKCDPVKQTDVSQKKGPDLTKPLPLERKPKPTEASTGPSKDLHFTPPKTLSNKERAQTKQEILTSKIKAHAEKEISAIKEKGFAIRDGLISKNPTKILAGSQSANIRQKPPFQDVSNKHESTVSSNITPKHQMEPSGIQKEPVKSVSPPSSAPIPVKSAATTTQLVDHLQKQDPKDPVKSNGNKPEPPKDGKQTGTNKSLEENEKKENQSGDKLAMQSKVQTEKTNQRKQEANQGALFGKQKEGLKNNSATITDHLKKKEEPSQATDLAKAENSKPVITEKSESKNEAAHEGSAPSLSIVFGKNTTPVVDDSLQIMGIMVTVRERKPSESNGEGEDSTREQIYTKEKEFSISKQNTCCPSSGLDVNKESKSSNEVSIAKVKHGVVQKTNPTVKEDQTRVSITNRLENIQDVSTQQTRKSHVSESVTEVQDSSSINAKPQRETQFQEPLPEKGVPSALIVPGKIKALVEDQPPKKQDTRETKDYSNKAPKENTTKSIRKDEEKRIKEEKNLQTQTAHTKENVIVKVENMAIIGKNDSNRGDAEALIKHKLSMTDSINTAINQSKNKDIDGKSTALLEEKRHDSTSTKPLSKTTPSLHLTGDQNRQVSPKQVLKETHAKDYNQVGDDVHIDSIAIRVVPAVTVKDSQKMEEKPVAPSNVHIVNEHKIVASSSHEEKVSTSNKEDKAKEPPTVCGEKMIKDSVEDKLEVQYVLSSVRQLSNSLRISNQQDSMNAPTEITQAENVKESGKSVDESKIQAMEGDYFQVQGGTDTNKESDNSTNVGETYDSVSKGRELPGLLPNRNVSNKPYKEEKNEIFVLDQSKSKTMGSSSVSSQNVNMEKKKWETEDKLSSKQSDGPTERQSNNETMEAGQANYVRKHHTMTQSSLSARERQSTRNSHPTREDSVMEKPEVKPKPKERVSTIPEISAIADYARLKVIVSEERANTIQEFPPNKKEGFFPLIQTRPSKRPVFTTDPKDISVKEKSLPNKTEDSAKVKKEPKVLIFPITEKEHQRTGMFKLGDKEKQEKMSLDAKGINAEETHVQFVQERKKSQTTHLKNQGHEEQVAQTSTQTLHQDHIRLWEEEKERLKQENTEKKSEEIQVPRTEEEKRAEDMKIKHILEESRASLAEEERRIAQREEERRAKEREAIALKIKERREKQRAEEERKAKQIEEDRAAQNEEEMRAKQNDEEKRMKETEEKRMKVEGERRANLRGESERMSKVEEKRILKQQEDKRDAQEELQKRSAQEEQQRRAAQEKQHKRAALEELQNRAAKEEQQKRTALEEQQRRTAVEEQCRKAAQEEQQRRTAKEEQQKRAVLEEQQRRAAQEEQQRRAAKEEKQKRAALEEQQRRAAQEEQQRRAAKEGQQKRAALEEQRRRAAREEQQARAALEEQQKKDALEEQQRRAAKEEQQRRALQEEQQKKAALEEQQKRDAQEEQQKRAALGEQQKKAALEEKQRAAKEEQQRRAVQQEQQKKAALEEQQRRAVQEEQEKRATFEEQRKRAAQEEQQRRAALQEWQRKAARIEEQRRTKQNEERILIEIEKEKRKREEEERKSAENYKTKQREQKKAEEEKIRQLEENQAALKEEKRASQERMLAQKEDEIMAKKREAEKTAALRENERAAQLEEQKRAAPKMDSVQYYAITSTDSERNHKERQLCSPVPTKQRNNPSGLESTEDSGSHTRPHRSHGTASPAPNLPRSNTSSPALGVKPSMFRVKDNTMRGSSFKSVKPRFHKNIGEDSQASSLSEKGSDRVNEEQEIIRRSSGTPVHPDTGLNRLAAIKEFSTFQSASSSQDYSAHLPQHRPYSRRSIALEEDDSRSVLSNMSEDVESFATSAADLADIRGLYDYERPESACSFSSDVSRSLGKPPAVPPKSEKALRRAKRLTTRRIKKELGKVTTECTPGDDEKPLQEVSSVPPSSSTEVCSSSRHAVASPHFSSPVSLAHAPALGASLPSHTEHTASHSYAHVSPHATGPISLPVASPYATAPVTLPVASPHATGPASHSAAAKIVAHVPSSPTFHPANQPAPVTQYHVESSYPQSYPLTQRKVLQDLGSGQYFVVDVPVQVKTKTFFDPETGKYVQLNVRESGQSSSQPQPQQTYRQPQLQSQKQVNPEQPPLNHAPSAGKPFVLHQGQHGYSKGYQPAAVNSMPPHRSSAPVTLHQDQQPVRENYIYGYPAPETTQNCEGHRYSPEKTPYMDTVNDTEKPYNTVYNTHGSHEGFPECDTNSQLAGSSVSENDNSAHSRYQSRDIITMSELEDFMEMSDW